VNEPFQPLGELARWRKLVEVFSGVDRGTTLTYDDLAQALELDPVKDRKAIRAAVRQAVPALSKGHDRSLVAVRSVGYRVVLPDEHVDLAGRQQRKSRKALVRAQTHVDHVDLSGLSEEGRRIVHAAASALAWQQAQIRRLDLRQKDLEGAVSSITTRVERTEAEHDARLAELERKIAELS
jgi:hypothetical protein